MPLHSIKYLGSPGGLDLGEVDGVLADIRRNFPSKNDAKKKSSKSSECGTQTQEYDILSLEYYDYDNQNSNSFSYSNSNTKKSSFLTTLNYKSISELRRHLDSLGDSTSYDLNLFDSNAPLHRTHRRMYWSGSSSSSTIDKINNTNANTNAHDNNSDIETKQIKDLQDLSTWRKHLMSIVVPDEQALKEEEEELQADFDLMKSLETTVPAAVLNLKEEEDDNDDDVVDII